MPFNSFFYVLLFLPAVCLLTALTRRSLGPRSAQIVVLLSSLLFYSWGKPSRLGFLAASILANWLLARLISSATEPARKRWLQIGLFANIAYLGAFKYVDFFIREIPFLHGRLHLPELSFPLGISFFTLAQVMYLVDCYEGLQPASDLFTHATFVSFFPYVISGPIAKSKRILHQFGNLGTAEGTFAIKTASGVYLFCMGLFKKVVFADAFAHIADFGFDAPNRLSSLEVLCFSGAYVLQLYFDFSGYSDMAIGAANMLGIEIPRNFDRPLRSKSIIEFWQRWHISLSSFITTYLYTPILTSFSQINLISASLATMLAMAIAGLWHGPSWTFVIFGLIHGVGLAANQVWRKKKLAKIPSAISWLLTLLLVDISLIFFRSPTVTQALSMISSLISFREPLSTVNLSTMHQQGVLSLQIFGPPILLGVLAAFIGPSSEQLAREFKPTLRSALAAAAIFVVACIFMNSSVGKQFVYFAF
jgi:alginate O-acetyltransferase complex protein AlgI